MKTLLSAMGLFACLVAASCQLDTSRPGVGHLTKQQLIGAWRLQSIQLIGPNGPMSDPFYGEGSTGLLIYDSSGWMSVQIVGSHRASVDVPASRPSASNTAEDARRKAEVLDGYYAYFANWEFDEAASVVTHHVVSSLYPSETGVSYSQSVAIDGEYLIFTTHRDSSILQKKVWRRIKDDLNTLR
jgi:hypothetical protein